MAKGIDISTYNTVNNWGALAKAVDFVVLKIIRADGNPDNKFVSHLTGCRNNGVLIQGVYNYSYATTVLKAKADAQLVIKNLKANNLSCAVWLDVEDKCQRGLKHLLIEIVRAYKAEIEAAGYPFGVYTGMSFYNSYFKPYLSEILDIPMWIARYPSTAKMDISANPSESKKPDILNMVAWQYSSKGVVPGISGDVDLNEYYAPLPNTTQSKYYPKYTGASATSIISGLAAVGEKDTSYSHRAKIAKANGIAGYAGTAKQNIKLLDLLKQGKLIRA